MAAARPKSVEKRNVVVLGRAGSGKSTVCNKITGGNSFQVGRTTILSTTTRPEHCEATLEEARAVYNFKVIDTVGLFDNSPPELGRPSNKMVMKNMKKFFNEIVPEGISLVLFVFQYGTFTQEEEDAFRFIRQNFRDDISQMSALIMTHCENDNEEARQARIDDFRKNQEENASFMEKGIFTVGFPDLFTVKPRLRPIFQQDIEDDTETLRDLVRRSDEMRLSVNLFQETFWETISRQFPRCTIL